jgi:hypothetical protein
VEGELPVVKWEDMTEEERDRFIYLSLTEESLKAIVMIMKRRYGSDVSTEQVMRFAFKVARDRMTPKHLRVRARKSEDEILENE